MLNSHIHHGPCHTSWAVLISITFETQISAGSKPCQNHQTSASILNEAVRVEGVFSVGGD